MKLKSFSALQIVIKRTAFLIIAAFVLVVVFVNRANANGAEFLVSNGNNFDVNEVQFKRVEYVGQCPGTVMNPGTRKAQFVSKSTPPAAKRKVTIRNVTQGMKSNPYPYTSRGYSEGEYSQGVDLSLGNSHQTRTFAVLEGENKFEYEIKEGERIIEQGTFTAEVSVKDVGVFPRDTICEEKLECRDDGDCYDRNGKKRGSRQRCYTTNTCNCPS